MTHQPERLAQLIAAVRQRWFLTVALRAVGIAMAVAALPMLAAAAVYWSFAPPGGALLLLAAVTAVLVIGGMALVIRRIERRPDDRRVARFIEERAEAIPGNPPLDDCVVSAVHALAIPFGDARAPFAALVIDAALRRLENIEPSSLIPSASMRRSAVIGAGGAALLVVALIAGAPGLSHTYETARLRLFPGSISVDVQPGDLRIAAGRPLTIKARVRADGTALARSRPTLTVTAAGDSRTVDMTAADDGFEFHFESVDRTFEYIVSAGSIASPPYTVTALFPPRVQRIDIQYQYPAFSGLSPRTEEDGGDIYAPVGTRVRLAIHVDKPVAAGELAMSAGASPLTGTGGPVVHADLVLAKDDSYRVRLTDRDGLASDGDSEYFIRLMDDRPPDVRILRPAGDQGITPLEEVAIEARAEDDHGVASLDLVYAVGGGPERSVPFTRISGGATERTGAHLLAAEDLNVKPGDVITYYARARDVGRGKRATETRSDLFFLEVRPFNEEFVAAQSQSGLGGAGDQQLDSLIEAQKEIISATWNIERRSGAGRSAADIKAIAQAQAELKARAERALGPGRGRRSGGFVPQQVVRLQQPPAGENPMASAVAAMTKAIEQLASDRTRDAITHEMTALNGLLQAQAEVRRREIAQQQNSNAGGRGSNRQTQDLSALFDKELQRQQRTNYEQRSQIEERPEQTQANQDAADRIRDLAKRQEAINARQRELERMAEEDRKRELAKLTRDQEVLQRQAEALAVPNEAVGPTFRSGAPNEAVGQASRSGAPNEAVGQASRSGAPNEAVGQASRSGVPREAVGPTFRSGAPNEMGNSSPSQPGQQQQQRPQGNAGMRGAAEQMRQAAADLQRNDPQSAARSGERAADQLRRLEQQMRGGGADARQRAAADLQSEAQQMAQEQRRIAGEAERLEKGAGADTADARRRLAADKDRLADRVESLEREAARLGLEQGKGEAQARAREAAGQLQRDRVGETMREGARAMRDGAAPPSGRSEQQVAKTLDQVVEKLGGAASNEARKMAGELDRSREARERLDRLEAGMKAAQGKQDGQFEALRQQYEQELRRTRETLGRPSASQRDARGGATPEEQQLSGSAPGTEAFKQDRSGWESLRKDVDRALEEHEAAVSRRLARVLGEDRMSAGGSQRVPEHYRHLVARYYESLARVKK